MSWRVVKCVLAHHDQKVRGLDLLVLVYLANHANAEDGSGAWPSQWTLAGETGMHRATVQRALARLEAAGALEVDPRPGRTHRFRVRMCAVCLPRLSAAESGTETNRVPHSATGGAAESDRGCRTVRHEPFIETSDEPPTNAVGASPLDERSPPARPASSEQDQSASNRKAEFIARRVEQIRQEQGDRAADAYLAKVAQNDAKDQRRAEVERLSSGVSPEGYAPFVPAWAREQWKADHPNTSLEEEKEP